VVLKVAQIGHKNMYQESLRRELTSRASHYRQHVAGELRTLAERLRGIHYEVMDVRAVAEQALAEGGAGS